MEYPRWKHHKEHKDKLVHSEDQLKSLGEGWGDDSSVWRPHLVKKDDEQIFEKAEDPPVHTEDAQKQKPGRKSNASKKISQ